MSIATTETLYKPPLVNVSESTSSLYGHIDFLSLKKRCIKGENVSESIKLCAGAWMDQAPLNIRECINAEFGLRYFNPANGKTLAVCGFDIGPNGEMIICHTPQGCHKGIISRNERRKLLSSDFRNKLLTAMIGLAKDIGCPEIIGIAAANHYKVIHGSITLEKGILIMDRLFEEHGFRKHKDGNYCLSLN